MDPIFVFVVAVIVVIGLIAVLVRMRVIPIDEVRDVLDRSLGMYAFRRLTGRPTPPVAPAPPPDPLSSDEVAYRIGAADEAPSTWAPRVAITTYPAPGQASPNTAVERARPVVAAGSAAAAGGLGGPRRQLVRDGGFALIGLAALGLAVFAVLPRTQGLVPRPSGSVFAVLRASVTPESSTTPKPSTAPEATPTGEVLTETATPAATASDTPVATPNGTKAPLKTATPAPTIRPTPPPTVRPTRTPTPTATPTATPNPSATAEPTPTATPTPTPTPAQPVASISASPSCAPAGVQIAFDGTGSTGATDYLWNFGDGSGSTFPTQSHAFLVDGAYTVSLTVTGPGGSSEASTGITVPCAVTP